MCNYNNMKKQIKTPIANLIEQFESELYHENTRDGLKYAIELSKRMLRKEKSIMCWFAREWHKAKRQNKY